MEKQMKAERERREAILRAEGEKARRDPRSRGRKGIPLFSAPTRRSSSRSLRPRGEAEAILKVQKATAEGIRLINEAAPSKPSSRSRRWKPSARRQTAKATKIIIPSEIQGVAGLASGLVEAVKG